jgi:type II secretion system protein N
MKRALLFLVLLLAFVVLTFPHRLLVERMLAQKLANTDLEVRFAKVRPSWPPGYALEDVDIEHGAYSVRLDELRFAATPFSDKLRFRALGCGGAIVGLVGTEDGVRELQVRFSDIDPSSCAHLDTLVVAGRIKGRIELSGLGAGHPAGMIGRAAEAGTVRVDASGGNVSGHLPAPPGKAAAGPGMAIGSWGFDSARIEAHVEDGRDIVVDTLAARAEGVEWQVPSARLAAGRGARDAPSITASLRARSTDASTRSKAILGLLPQAGENDEGWRRYRISGTLDAPKIIGLR